jgi:predicted HicB family RNase H-like nuclease
MVGFRYRERRMKKEGAPLKQQLGVRIDTDLVVETKVLAARQRRRVNDLVEEALRDLLKKYREKARETR